MANKVIRYLSCDGVHYNQESEAMERGALIDFKYWYEQFPVLDDVGRGMFTTDSANVFKWVQENKHKLLDTIKQLNEVEEAENAYRNAERRLQGS